jgi:hypothetical protein
MANVSVDANIGEKNANYVRYANIVGACISFIVFIGVLGWGARTLMRDSSGVPVVRALEGPTRVSPSEPGGVPASHQGLTVNQVSSSQKNLFIDESLQLAPAPINLKLEDIPIGTVIIQEVAEPIKYKKIEALLAGALIINSNGDKEIVDQLASMLAATSLGSPTDNLINKDNTIKILSMTKASNVQLNASFRPKLRSNFLVKTLLDSNIIAGDGKIPLGTQMVQLGAYTDKQAASQAWKDLSAHHSDYFIGKANVILTGKIADQEIYRLRVYGFKDIAESRRLCTALRGQNTECYPVVMN